MLLKYFKIKNPDHFTDRDSKPSYEIRNYELAEIGDIAAIWFPSAK